MLGLHRNRILFYFMVFEDVTPWVTVSISIVTQEGAAKVEVGIVTGRVVGGGSHSVGMAWSECRIVGSVAGAVAVIFRRKWPLEHWGIVHTKRRYERYLIHQYNLFKM